MSDDPLYIKLLDKLGVNTTRLKWGMYKREEKARQVLQGNATPSGFQWFKYPHKTCPHCGAINDKEARVCGSCGQHVPSMLGYRIGRAFQTVLPQDKPVVTSGFLGLIILFFVIQISLQGFSMRTVMGVDGRISLLMGSFRGDVVEALGHYWRFMSFGLLHGGLLHIGMNGYVMNQIGAIIEMRTSKSRMIVLITLTQVSSALACFIWYWKINESAISVVGASGWLFGLIGYGIVHFHQSGLNSMRDQLIKWTGIMLLIGFVIPIISNTGHVGGLLGGMAVALLPSDSRNNRQQLDRIWTVAAWICVAVWLITIVFMFKSVMIHWEDIQGIKRSLG
ncbi:MAG: hypothetical protein COA73_08945 [Candidatus Hydrogenedentota bacterium]|nr:MAG: hypothetical protein COA73_08945 [Candidatus Hydrogenedentota bacterium]